MSCRDVTGGDLTDCECSPGHDYLRPTTLAEALRLRREIPGARFVAGGTDLLVQMCARKAASRALVSLRRVPGLDGVEVGATIRIGALTTIADLLAHPEIRATLPALATAASRLASPQIRNAATVGGNLCNASPCADLPPPLIAYDARAEIVGPAGVRQIPLLDLFVAPGMTSLRDDEVLTAVVVPWPSAGTRGVYLRKGRVHMDLALASVAVVACVAEGVWTDVRVVAGAVGPIPLRLTSVEDLLRGTAPDDDLAARVGEAAARAVAPIDDVRASAWYRRRVIAAFASRAVRAVAADQGDRHVTDAAPTPPWATPDGPPTPCPAGKCRDVSFVLNGERVTVSMRPGTRLLDALREGAGRTGTKEGCGEGECGACTVLVDGRSVNSCLYPALEVEGRHVTTVEGLGRPGELSDLQQAFVSGGGIQCGFCTPGMLISAESLLRARPDASRTEIARGLAGNLCRCTGYVQIVDSIVAAAERRRRGEEVAR